MSQVRFLPIAFFEATQRLVFALRLKKRNQIEMANDIFINVETLKNESPQDYLIHYLEKRASHCRQRRQAYWEHFTSMKFRHNFISIPLLVLSSGTGVASAAQLNGNIKDEIGILVTVLGVSSAILTAVQRYCGYSERAENSKLMAKSWGRLSRRIENTLLFVKSKATSVNDTVFTKMVEEIQKDIDAVAQQAEDIPSKLWKKPEKIEDSLPCENLNNNHAEE
jgi:hypothetical protein